MTNQQKQLFLLYRSITGKTTYEPKSHAEVEDLTTWQMSRVQQYQMREL